MKLLKMVATAAIATALAVPAVARAQDTSWLGGTPKKPLNALKIGFSFRGGGGGNLYVTQYVDKLKEIAKTYGITVDIVDAEDDPGRQSQQMPELIAKHPDAIVVWALNAAGIVPAIKRVHNAGIPVVTIVADIDPSGKDYVTAHAGPNDTREGTQAAEALIDAMGGKGNVVELRGPTGFGPADQRAQAFLDVAKKHPDIHLLDAQDGNWSVNKGQSIMETFITRFGKRIDGVLSSDGYTGTGAYLAVDAAVKAGTLDDGHIKFSDPNGVATAFDLVKQGKYSSTVLQLPQDDAAFSFRIAIKVAEGIPVARYNYLPTPVVTRANVSQYPRPGL